MPSFDVVSAVDKHELSNAIDQANREVGTRFDLKGTNARIDYENEVLTIVADAEFQLKQVVDIFKLKLTKRGVDIGCLKPGEIQKALSETRQRIEIQEGIGKDAARQMTKLIKGSKLKVQAQVQQEQLRVTGKSRDALQDAMALLKNEDFGLPLQFTNFRD
ncbi:MAG: YajQ family cyclic di-GMP-binding protein [Pseudomonadota bacterium]